VLQMGRIEQDGVEREVAPHAEGAWRGITGPSSTP
jgi:hypothetical protein